MRLHFSTNDYLITWNLLFGSSFSETVHTFKQRLYKTYRNQYNHLSKDKDEMLQENFIPDDDTLYNLVFETELFTKLKNASEKHRLALLKIWDQQKKTVDKYLKEILKFPLKEDYQILVLPPVMDSILYKKEII